MIDHNKFQSVIKNAFNRVSTFKNTPWYNETNVKSKKKIEIEDINVQQSPQIPSWEDNSSNFSDVDYSSSFPLDVSFLSLHTIKTDGKYINYINNGEKSPGIYLDESGSVALFVRMKLVALNDPDICSNSFSYTAYPTDTSDNLLLENAYNFNYNSQLNVDGIDVFKPYNYTLEYYDDVTNSFVTLDHSDNWIFDNDTGIIVFETQPTNTNLYFTFVKYIGVQGLENLLYYKDGKIGIGNKYPQYELDISGSVDITGNLDIGDKLTINNDVLFIDNSYVGINTDDPQYELDVSGSVIIDGDLSINCGIGPGFFPIGAIIMWPTCDFPDGYGKWLLCDGSVVSSTEYPDLSNVLGSVEGITLPDFQDNYVKMPDSGTTKSFSTSGENVSYFKLQENHVPDHTHTSTHTHDISDSGHTHQTNAHSHDISDNGHFHETKAHSHTISDNGHTHKLDKHTHNISDNGHTHEIPVHVHSINDQEHTHEITKWNANVSDSGGNTAGGGNIYGVGYSNVDADYGSDADTGYSVDDTDTQYRANMNTQSSDSVEYNISLVANNDNTTTEVDSIFTIGSDVLDRSATTQASSSINVGDSSDNDTSNSSSNLTVGNISGSTDISSSVQGSSNDDLSLDISGLPHSTAFFFIRAK